jgi:FtsX-like permease family protein
VGTNGSAAAIERARTALEIGFPDLGPPATLLSAHNSYTELQHMTDVVILVSLVIAGCSLAVSAVAGLADRKRAFSLLRLTGVQLGVLHRVVALETTVPLVVIAAVSAGAGLLASELFLKSELGETLRAPGTGYYLVVLAGLVISLSVIASTLPLLKRITGSEAARNE